jgi:hypothetical protein
MATTVGPTQAGAGSNYVIGATWTSPNNIASGTEAYYSRDSWDTDEIIAYLRASSFGFSIPTGATISGILVEVNKRQSISGSGDFGCVDGPVKLFGSGGTPTGNDKGTATEWALSYGYISYGSSSDMWGTSLTATDINSSNFGAGNSAHPWWGADGGGLQKIGIKNIRISITYTAAASTTRVTQTRNRRARFSTAQPQRYRTRDASYGVST